MHTFGEPSKLFLHTCKIFTRSLPLQTVLHTAMTKMAIGVANELKMVASSRKEAKLSLVTILENIPNAKRE